MCNIFVISKAPHSFVSYVSFMVSCIEKMLFLRKYVEFCISIMCDYNLRKVEQPPKPIVHLMVCTVYTHIRFSEIKSVHIFIMV